MYASIYFGTQECMCACIYFCSCDIVFSFFQLHSSIRVECVCVSIQTMHTSLSTQVHMCTHVNIRANRAPSKATRLFLWSIYIYIYKYTCIHMYIYTYKYVYMYVYMCISPSQQAHTEKIQKTYCQRDQSERQEPLSPLLYRRQRNSTTWCRESNSALKRV